MVTASFLDDIRLCTWSADHLIQGDETVYPFVQLKADPHRWAIGGSGCLIAQSTFALLYAGTANSDGSFTSGSTTYTLHNDSGRVLAVPV